ncbi:MAG: uracil-DNA glycosylase [Spirochaetaceae bacterium]|jgi:DNA polymerase|nr:uracil-DNA glycosylase [Spirochaetaceae bacterium]
MKKPVKNALALFFDLAAASLSTGFCAKGAVYDFEDDAEGTTENFPAPNSSPPSTPKNNNDSLEKIAKDVCACSACKLGAGRKNAVPGEGVPHPLVLVVGEGPGADEDASGRPFVGPAGQKLDEMLASIGLSRSKNCFIANIVKCRPPGNRDPESDETRLCMRFLERQIDLLQPLLILSAGRTSTANLLQTGEGITRLRGIWKSFRGIPLLPTFHPSYLLRDPNQKKFAWEDMKSLCRRLAELNPQYEAETGALRAARKI